MTELQVAWEFVEHTGRSVFLTGRAGTGKTTFLKRVKELSHKRLIVVAPTGVAAINAGGVTIHSFFQLPLSPYVPGAKIQEKHNFSNLKRKIIRSLDLLIIDEISMVRADVLDAVSHVLQRYRGSSLPFGGVQLLMIGDLQQLTPVVTGEEQPIISKFYDTAYFFGSRALEHVPYVTIELKQVFRQQQGDFLDILNHIREGKTTYQDLQKLNKRYLPYFHPQPEDGYIRLTTHNRRADDYNERELYSLATPEVTFNAEIEGTFPDYLYPTATALKLKVGAQVMFIKNDPSTEHLYYNGRIGHVTDIGEGVLKVKCGEDIINVTPMEWENASYTLNEDTKEIETEVKGLFRQIPLRLAWAITIHKSQGLTFDRVIIEADAAFASGQVYVALSRCRTIEGIVLAASINMDAIINDKSVTNYINNQEKEAAKSIEALPVLKREYYREMLIELFSFDEMIRCEEVLLRCLIEFYSKYYPTEVTSHKAVSKSLKKDIDDVAKKWTSLIESMDDEEVHGEIFLERVKRSCSFFENHIVDALKEPLESCKELKSNNKAVVKRMDNALADMTLAYLTKVHLLRYVAKEGFTVPTYLNFKQKSILLAIEGKEEDVSEIKQVRRSEIKNNARIGKKSNKEKCPKRKSSDISLEMFLRGKTISEIAEERGFTFGTISKHLYDFVLGGKLPFNDFVSKEKEEIIRRAIDRVSAKNSIVPIKQECPDNVTYDEIRAVIATNQGKVPE